jgi:hypothetical protein
MAQPPAQACAQCGVVTRLCGCTRYAKKRRLLRRHRVQMRIMDEIIADHGLDEELEEALIDETGNTGFWLGIDSDGMDEGSDREDPERVLQQQVAELRKEAADASNFVAAAQQVLERHRIQTDLERARMQLEDLRAHSTR